MFADIMISSMIGCSVCFLRSLHFCAASKAVTPEACMIHGYKAYMLRPFDSKAAGKWECTPHKSPPIHISFIPKLRPYPDVCLPICSGSGE